MANGEEPKASAKAGAAQVPAGAGMGVLETRYDDGKLRERSQMKNGKLDGDSQSFSPEGRPLRSARLREGVLEGRRTYANIMKYLMMATSSNFGNMLSMAAATLFLPFLPLLPVQILLNNLLYDISEVPIPLDHVEEGDLRQPRVWDMQQIRRFMLTLGPVSSVFDLLTFALLLLVLHADASLFRTGWFIESIATQVLVVFVIRTRHNPLRSRPRPLLAATCLAVVGVAVALPFTPVGEFVGLVRPPLPFFAMLIVLVLVYLALAEYCKRWFYRTQKAHARERAKSSLSPSRW